VQTRPPSAEEETPCPDESAEKLQMMSAESSPSVASGSVARSISAFVLASVATTLSVAFAITAM
jgi:hypothetical protein